MNLRKNLKRQAKQALHGSQGRAKGLLLILMGVQFCIHLVDTAIINLLGYSFEYSYRGNFSYSENFFYSIPAIGVSVLSWVISLLLVAPLAVGMVNWYMELIDRRSHGCSYLFWPYENRTWLRAGWLKVGLMLRLLPVYALLLLPSVVLIYLNRQFWLNPISMAGYHLGRILLVIAAVLMWAYAQRYRLASMLIGRYQLKVREAIRQSVRYTKGHRWELVRLDISFLPWLIPVIIIAGITYDSMGSFYSIIAPMMVLLLAVTTFITIIMLYPYYTMTSTMYCRYLYESGQCEVGRESSPAAAAAEDTPGENPPAENMSGDGAGSDRLSGSDSTGAYWHSVDEPSVILPPQWQDTPDTPENSGVVWHNIDD